MEHSALIDVAEESPSSPTQTSRTVSHLDGFTEETYASSPSILAPTRNGSIKGLQQYFTPPAAARFIQSIINPHGSLRVVDPTAGDGSLLWPHTHRFGIELDEQAVRKSRSISIGPDDPRYTEIAAKQGAEQTSGTPFRLGDSVTVDQSYTVIRGDLQHVYPLLRVSATRFSAIVANPPFGLTWEIASLNTGRSASSTLLTWLICQQLGVPGVHGAFICGSSRLDREILVLETSRRAVYCVLDVLHFFAGVDLPCSIAFWADPEFRSSDTPYLRLSVPSAAVLQEHMQVVQEARQLRFSRLPTYDSTDQYRSLTTTEAFALMQDAYNRRTATRVKQVEYDVQLKGDRIEVHLSPLAIAVMDSLGELAATKPFLMSLHRQRSSYFALNTRDWRRLQQVIDSALITMRDSDRSKIDAIVQEAKKVACPVYPIEPQQRLAYIQDLENLTCTESDTERGYINGQTYPVDVSTEIDSRERQETKVVEGELTTLTFRADYKVLKIMVGGDMPRPYSETKEDIDYLLSHFDIPDPGDVSTRYPEAIEKWRGVIRSVQHRFMPEGISPKPFQVEDVARLLFKGSGVLSWEQGGGKTFGSMLTVLAFHEADQADGNALFIVPQDLIPQWTEEARKFFNRELTHIATRAQARRVRQGIKSGELAPAWYITHYEALAINDLRFERIPVLDRIQDGSFIRTTRQVACERGRAVMQEQPVIRQVTTYTVEQDNASDSNQSDSKKQQSSFQTIATTGDLCPRCLEPSSSGNWDGYHCKRCGETRAHLVLKPMAHELAVAFKNGCIVVDEGTKIKADRSLTSLGVRGLRARHRILLTGTPQKNYVHDLFHLLCWALGPASVRFPFAWGSEGKSKFEADFCVVEKLVGGKRRKILPEVTNLSVLWRLLSGAIIRRRKEHMGEPIVERTFLPVTVPFGTRQRKQYERWLKDFSLWYHDRHPDIDLDDIERQSAILGQLVKLEYATTLPAADPDADYWKIGVSNWTPKLLKVLEIAGTHAARGEKVLIGSDLMLTGKVIASQLTDKGILSAHILDETGQTLNPRQRAVRIREFIGGDTSVLCASVQSIALGHNLDCASVVILMGLPWDFATLDQFLARVHRLTSKQPVKIYIVLTEGSLDERKWKLLQDKTASAELAIDGHLVEKKQKPISQQEILNELKRKGLPVADTVPEDAIFRSWQEMRFATSPACRSVDTPVIPTANTPAPVEPPSLFQFPISPTPSLITQLCLFDALETVAPSSVRRRCRR